MAAETCHITAANTSSPPPLRGPLLYTLTKDPLQRRRSPPRREVKIIISSTHHHRQCPGGGSRPPRTMYPGSWSRHVVRHLTPPPSHIVRSFDTWSRQDQLTIMAAGEDDNISKMQLHLWRGQASEEATHSHHIHLSPQLTSTLHDLYESKLPSAMVVIIVGCSGRDTKKQQSAEVITPLMTVPSYNDRGHTSSAEDMIGERWR
jgi:hypothetical protein